MKVFEKFKIFIDTDMGSDCDDTAAIAILSHLDKIGKINIIGISHTVSNPLLAQYIDYVSFYYGDKHYSIGLPDKKNDKIVLEDDYISSIIGDYCNPDISVLNSVKLLRKSIAENYGIKLLFIGTLNNARLLLDSKPDEISPLSGMELIRKNVSEIIVMGGNFRGKEYDFYGYKFTAEYNIRCDIESAKVFIEKCPALITFADFEIGYQVMSFKDTVASMLDSPIKRAYMAMKCKERESWDVVAAIYAATGLNDCWEYSKFGNVSVNDDGMTIFNENDCGRRRYLIEKASKYEIEKLIASFEKQLFNYV